MLSGESTPLLKESIELREGEDKLDMNGSDRNSVLFSGTKALQVEKAGEGGLQSELKQPVPPRRTNQLTIQLLMMDVWLSFSEQALVQPRVSWSEL
jgi:magnesium-transporting ATPase (P-type)